MNKFYDEIQKGYLAKAEELQKDLIRAGFMATRIEKGDDRTDFKVIFYDGTHEYDISRDYSGHVRLARVDYKRYPNVSSYVRGEVFAKHREQNVKVITHNKIQRKIDAENAYHAEMDALNKGAEDKTNAFIDTVKALEAQGIEVKWSHERAFDGTVGKITGGRIERNGLEFSFEVSNDGYISKNMRVSYVPETSLDVFLALSTNEYRPEKTK